MNANPLFGLSNAFIVLLCASVAFGFSVDTSEQPAAHPPQTPSDGEEAVTNPPAMIWRVDDRAATYTLEMSQNPEFKGDAIRVEGIDMPFYNHSAVLAKGTWHWRYYVVTKKSETSEPSPVKRFVITEKSIPFPVPKRDDILKTMPPHPRIFVTKATLEEFRKRRLGPAKEAWEDIQWQAEQYAKEPLPKLTLLPFPDDPGKERGKIFCMKDGKPFVPKGLTPQDVQGLARKAAVLAFAYLITEDKRHAEAAKRWVLFISDFRVDYHLKDRAEHDSVVYCYEYALKYMAVTFDHIYNELSEAERKRILDAIQYQGIASYGWIHDKLKLHLNYQNSHGQQNMHALLTTALAVAADLPEARAWADYLIRQYVNRVAWGGDDGGYTEGQTYSHKVQFILEGLCALRTSTGLDVFKKPRWRNTGDFWLYCMSLNYWWNHWGDCYPLLLPMYGNGADGYIANFLSSMTQNPYVKWWSDSVVCPPTHIPLQYLSSGDLKPRPPVDISQARLFPEVGQLAVCDRFYDHHGSRVFFRSSPWGSASHSHCDQNGFVIHAFGEILAPEAGYYTYCGDTYHKGFSVQTVAHNSVLVNGEGQPKSIESKGRVTEFFNSPRYCLFTGDASRAYGDKLRKFHRAVLFIRPDVFIVYDELEAPQPSEFTWLLHSFEPADLNGGERSIIVKQRGARLLVKHLAPDDLNYSQDNKRPYPMMTRKWTRYSEMFPQPWTIRVKTKQKQAAERILALLHTFAGDGGSQVAEVSRTETDHFLGVSLRQGEETIVTLFQRDLGRPTTDTIDKIATDAKVAGVSRSGEGKVVCWMAHGVRNLSVDGRELFTAAEPCDVSVDLGSNAGAAQVCCKLAAPCTVWFGLGRLPKTILAAPPNRPQEARPLPVLVRRATVGVQIDAGETVLWVDPVRDLTKPPPAMGLSVRDSQGEYTVPLDTAVADDGDIIAFAELAPREPGAYSLTSSDKTTDLLAQDRWDPTVSRRGMGAVEATLREGCEFFARFSPRVAEPKLEARLKESFRGRIVSLLRNGNFEEGAPLYPPRGWTVNHNRKNDMGWPGWSQEGACEGKACMKIVRDKANIRASSQPMRLRTGGRYGLRFKAKGNAPSATVSVSGAQGTTAKVEITPSEEWKEYRTELDVQPGYCIISVDVKKGEEANQELWLDDMEFGYEAK